MQSKQLLIIGYIWPEPTTTAAGNRMLQLIHFFLGEGYQITFSSTATESDKSLNLEALGIQKAPIKLNHASFNEFVASLNPEIVLFDRFLTEEQFGWRVAEFAPKALRILDTEDLHSLRHAREKAFKSGIDFTTDLWLQNDMTKREISSSYRSDVSLIISSYEMYLLKDVIKMDEAILWHLPFMIEPLTERDIKAWKSFEERTDFVCIGNGKHAPNLDAIILLKTEIWPLIKKQLSDAKLHIYGAYLPERVQQMHKPSEGFLVHDWAEDVKTVMENAKINLAPIRFGAGLKGKLLDAMRYATPSVTTSVGAEGMHDGLDFNGCIADTSEDFAREAVELYLNEPEWQKAQQNGATIINQTYARKSLIKDFVQKINNVLENLEEHRAKNFIGAMLQHQTMVSTKYLSKWIETKNRN